MCQCATWSHNLRDCFRSRDTPVFQSTLKVSSAIQERRCATAQVCTFIKSHPAQPQDDTRKPCRKLREEERAIFYVTIPQVILPLILVINHERSFKCLTFLSVKAAPGLNVSNSTLSLRVFLPLFWHPSDAKPQYSHCSFWGDQSKTAFHGHHLR